MTSQSPSKATKEVSMTISTKTCSVDGCNKGTHSGGTKCGMHYARLAKYGSTELPIRLPKRCSIGGCTRKFYGRNYCNFHYQHSITPGNKLFDGRELGICKVKDCGKYIANISWGYCNGHYLRHLRTGDATNVKRRYYEHRRSSPLYGVYMGMKQRCYDKKTKSYKYYGGRGINVCARWLGIDGFTKFLEDMGERPEGYTLDRIDVDGDYAAKNCRWANYNVQAINRRMRRTNTSGITGVCKTGGGGKWMAQICTNGTKVTQYFYNKEDAVEARIKMEAKYHKPLLEAR